MLCVIMMLMMVIVFFIWVKRECVQKRFFYSGSLRFISFRSSRYSCHQGGGDQDELKIEGELRGFVNYFSVNLRVMRVMSCDKRKQEALLRLTFNISGDTRSLCNSLDGVPGALRLSPARRPGRLYHLRDLATTRHPDSQPRSDETVTKSQVYLNWDSSRSTLSSDKLAQSQININNRLFYPCPARIFISPGSGQVPGVSHSAARARVTAPPGRWNLPQPGSRNSRCLLTNLLSRTVTSIASSSLSRARPVTARHSPSLPGWWLSLCVTPAKQEY